MRAVLAAVNGATGDAVGGAIGDATGGAIGDAVDGTTGEAAGGAQDADVKRYVGRRLPSVDGPGKVTGRAVFGADGAPAGALRLRVVRSPHAHARFTLGDCAALHERHPGLARILTAADVPGVNGFGIYPEVKDQPVLAPGIVRYRGEAMFALVGDADTLARLTDDRLPIQWEPLPAVSDPRDALAVGAPPVNPDRPDNVLARGRVHAGEVPPPGGGPPGRGSPGKGLPNDGSPGSALPGGGSSPGSRPPGDGSPDAGPQSEGPLNSDSPGGGSPSSGSPDAGSPGSSPPSDGSSLSSDAPGGDSPGNDPPDDGGGSMGNGPPGDGSPDSGSPDDDPPGRASPAVSPSAGGLLVGGSPASGGPDRGERRVRDPFHRARLHRAGGGLGAADRGRAASRWWRARRPPTWTGTRWRTCSASRPGRCASAPPPAGRFRRQTRPVRPAPGGAGGVAAGQAGVLHLHASRVDGRHHQAAPFAHSCPRGGRLRRAPARIRVRRGFRHRGLRLLGSHRGRAGPGALHGSVPRAERACGGARDLHAFAAGGRFPRLRRAPGRDRARDPDRRAGGRLRHRPARIPAPQRAADRRPHRHRPGAGGEARASSPASTRYARAGRRCAGRRMRFNASASAAVSAATSMPASAPIADSVATSMPASTPTAVSAATSVSASTPIADSVATLDACIDTSRGFRATLDARIDTDRRFRRTSMSASTPASVSAASAPCLHRHRPQPPPPPRPRPVRAARTAAAASASRACGTAAATPRCRIPPRCA